MAKTYPGVQLQQGRPQTESHAGSIPLATAFLGTAQEGPVEEPIQIRSIVEFERLYGKVDQSLPMTIAVRDFFLNGGREAKVIRVDADYSPGLAVLDTTSPFGVLCILPLSQAGDVPPEIWQAALGVCVRRDAFLIIDPPSDWDSAGSCNPEEFGLTPAQTSNAAVYFPRLTEVDGSALPSGAVAGIIARTDIDRGVWKAPAGPNAQLRGTVGLSIDLNDEESRTLNEAGVNVLRTLPGTGAVLWGARTLCRDCSPDPGYKYIPVRRLAIWIEGTLSSDLQWTVFEPNAEPLWQKIRTQVSNVLHDLYVQGALLGPTPASAYFVKCDRSTTTQSDINQGLAIVVVGFAPLKPGEFILLRIAVKTG